MKNLEDRFGSKGDIEKKRELLEEMKKILSTSDYKEGLRFTYRNE